MFVSYVSVPFRGSRSEMRTWWYLVQALSRFPSPFGVHVLKFDEDSDWYDSQFRLFPSPFGVHVLKFAWQEGRLSDSDVSVPFRGSRSEIFQGRREGQVRD